MDIFGDLPVVWQDDQGDHVDPTLGIREQGAAEVRTSVDFGHGAKAGVIEFNLIELDLWSGQSVHVRIGEDELDLGRFWHDTNDAHIEGNLSGSMGAITWSIDSETNPKDIGGDPRWRDEAHFVRITAEGLQGLQQISVSTSLDHSDGDWQVQGFSAHLQLPDDSTVSHVITDFDGGRVWAGATGARNAGVTGITSALQGTANAYEVHANGDGVWGHADYWLNLGTLSGGTLDLSDAGALIVDATLSRSDVPISIFVRDKDDGWLNLGAHLGGVTQVDLQSLPNDRLDQLNAMVLRVYEADLTTHPDQTGATNVLLKDMSFTLPASAALAEKATSHDLGTHDEGALTFDSLPGLAEGQIVWTGNANGGTLSYPTKTQIGFQTDDRYDGPASFDYVVRDQNGMLERHRAFLEVQALSRWSDLHANTEPDATVVIGAGQRVFLDQDVQLGSLIIDGGELIALDDRDINLTAERVLVMDGGLLQVGTKDNPFTHEFTLVLTGDDAGFDLDLRPYADCHMHVDQVVSRKWWKFAGGVIS